MVNHMNLSNIVTRIKYKVGLINIATPFEDLDGMIVDIIQKITVPVFSIYCPYKTRMAVDINDFEVVEKQNNYRKVLLPLFHDRKLLYVYDVNYDESVMSGLGFYAGGYPVMTANAIQELAISNASAPLMNYIIPKITFKFEPPRLLTIYNIYSSAKMILYLGFEHDGSLATIPETAREEFLQLALLDVKENLYPTLKQYTELNTAIGNINLKLDDWQNAESERKDLLEKWNDTYHLDFQPMYYI